MTTEQTKNAGEQPRDPECFEEWLVVRLREQPDREDEICRAARWVLGRMNPGHPARWTPEPILLARHGHTCDVPAHYENHLRHAANLSEEFIEMFFRVYDLYLREDSADHDQMVGERSRKAGEVSGGAGNGNDKGGAATASGDKPENGPQTSYSWESWTRFFHELHGSEQLGYEIDEDGYPVDDEPWGGVEGR
jgi:hypothetical protein